MSESELASDGSSIASAAHAADPSVAREIDATGLSCPMPVIELARAVEQLTVGQRVALIATDPAARVDVPVWCRMQRHRLVATQQHAASWRFVIERCR